MTTSLVKDLPDTLKRALGSFGIHGGKIGLSAAESTDMQVFPDTGCRGKVILVNLDSGETQEFGGSWGGSNMFNPGNAVDNDDTRRQIAPGFAVIKGYTGYRNYASIYLNPVNMVKMLPPTTSLSLPEAFVLTMCSYKASYRREAFKEFDEKEPQTTSDIIKSLESKGLIKLTKVGMSRTVDGDNALSHFGKSNDFRVSDSYYGYEYDKERWAKKQAQDGVDTGTVEQT